LRSLRGRLLLWLLGLLTVVAMLAGVAAYVIDRGEVDQSLDVQLRQIALNIGDTRRPVSGDGGGVSLDPEDALVVTISDVAGQRRTSDASVSIPLQTETGFTNVTASGEAWRSYTLVEPNRTVQVSQRREVRDEFAASSAERVVLPILGVLPLLWVMVGWIVARALKPLGRLTTQLRGWGEDRTDSLEIHDVPEEVLPLAVAMNDLIVRLDGQIEFRRQFISDAAHELRTPLTALRLQVNNLRKTSEYAGGKAAIDEMERGLRRTSDMISQVLDLARAESKAEGEKLGAVPLEDAIAASVEDVMHLANDKGIDVSLDSATDATVAGHRADIRTVLKNLLDNAIRYTPNGGSVDLAVRRSAESVTVEICDTGPGIPDALLDRVFERFFRAAGNGVEGSGLGLPIVSVIAARCGATVTLHNRRDRSGLVARVAFREAAITDH